MFFNHRASFFGTDISNDNNGGQFGTEGLRVVVLHVLIFQGGDGRWCRFSLKRIVCGKQRSRQGLVHLVRRALQLSGTQLSRLLLDDLESIGGKRWMQFIVSNQFNPAREFRLEYLQAEVRSGGSGRRDIVERFLECDAVQSLRAIREQALKNVRNS